MGWALFVAGVIVILLTAVLIDLSRKLGKVTAEKDQEEEVKDAYKKAEEVANKPAANNVDDLIKRL